MKLKNIHDIAAFKKVLRSCKGDVWLESIYGDKFNLKSELSQYLALYELLRDENEKLELLASLPEDRLKLAEFLASLNQ